MIPNFEWDLNKARENVRKHGISFEEAASVFADDDAMIEDDIEHSDEEDRFIIVGMSAHERVLLAVYTIRDKQSVRIINSRHPTRHEKRAYEEHKARRTRD
ncbi:MAG TPA: BrnT family toxin [Thermoanaerobaculia bacterium]|nr:BrnT family toxin [Thermoanaerobaculia bacterium]